MTRYPKLHAGVLLLFFLLLLRSVFVSGFFQNKTYVTANKVYALSAIDQQSMKTIADSLHPGNCSYDYDLSSTKAIIEAFDSCYVNHILPLHIITNTVQLSANTLAQGSSQPVEAVADRITLFGTRYISSRLFILSEEPELWVISVHAKHDAPAPVILEVWLDDRFVGNLNFDKGDDSWETLSLSAQIAPGFHNFYLWYVNDLFDAEQGLDRNAYIEYVHITR